MNMMRLSISLLLGLAFGLFCAWGTVNVQIQGLAVTNLVLLSIIYNRILLGFFIGIVEDVCLIKCGWLNSVIRGSLMGAIISLAIALPGGFSALPFLVFGAAYGLVIDLAATTLAPKKEVVCFEPGKAPRVQRRKKK